MSSTQRPTAVRGMLGPLSGIWGIFSPGWSTALRLWNLIRPGWPVPTAIGILITALTAIDQGKEVLYAVDVQNKLQYCLTFGSVAIFSIYLYLTFLRAISRYYPDLSSRTWRGFGPRVTAASVAALALPIVLVNFYFSRLPEDWRRLDAFGRLLGGGAPAIQFFGASAALAAVAAWAYFFPRYGVKTYKSPFSEVPLLFRRTHHFLFGLRLFLVLSAVALFVDPGLGAKTGPVFVGLTGVALWAGIACRVEAWLASRRWPPLTIFLVLVSMALFPVGQHFGLRSHNSIMVVDRALQPPRDDLDQHASNWLSNYMATYPKDAPPVVVVLAEGGGIRAALHSGMVLSELDAASCGEFMRHVYAVSSVSGGSVGVAAFVAARSPQAIARRCSRDVSGHPVGTTAEPTSVRSLLTEDHFSPLLAGLLFTDAPLSFIPLPVPDRAEIFEASLSAGQGYGPLHDFAASRLPIPVPSPETRQIGSRMRGDFEAAISSAFEGSVPVFLFNTVRSNDGDLETITNVGLTRQPSTKLINVLDRVSCNSTNGKTLSLATAAIVSARFPGITPPGVLEPSKCSQPPALKQRIRYVDGGYLDNSGAMAAAQAVSALIRACKTYGDKCPTIRVLHIYGRDEVEGGELPQSDDVAPEVSGPLTAWWKTGAVLGRAPVENLCRLVLDHNRERLARHDNSATSGRDDCAELSSLRTIDRARAITEGDSVVTRSEPLGWINAPLDIGADGSPDFAPLGWLLGPSQAHILETATGHRQREVCEAFNRLENGAGSNWRCGH